MKTKTDSGKPGTRAGAAKRRSPGSAVQTHGIPLQAKKIFDSMGNAVSIQDRDLRVVYQNSIHQQLTGSHVGELCYKAYSRVDEACRNCPVEASFRDGLVHTLIKQRAVDGNVMDLEITASPLMDESGAVIAGIEIVRDITLQRRTEAALREERNFVTTVLDTLDAQVLVLDTRGRIVRFNRACERTTGYIFEEVKGKYVWDLFFTPKEADIIREFFTELSADKFPDTFRTFWVARDGSRRLISWSTTALLDWEGNVKYVIPTGIDITDHHRADEALAAEKEQLAVTLSSIGDGVITTDMAGRVLLINKVAGELTGWSQEAAAGRKLETVFPIVHERTREKLVSPLERVLKNGTTIGISGTAILTSRDGAEHLIADSAAPIKNTNGATIGAVLVFRDVTERRIMEEEILKSEKIESLGILAGGIAHDYNNLLTAILGNINLARNLIKRDDVALAIERLADAERASGRARDLTRQLLTFSKGGVPIKKTTSIADLVRESAGFALRGASVKCEYFLPEELWSIEADEGQISQVMHNLIINAVQAMPGGGTISVRCENVTVPSEGMQMLSGGQYVKVSVTDSGTGIKPDHVKKIFDPYFTTKKKGIGLGLATSYSVVKRHDGLLTVESVPGMGTTFHVYLPASSLTPVRPQEPMDDSLEGTGKVLIMDDEELVRTTAGEMLKSLGYSVEVARDGAEAVQRYSFARSEGRPFDAVIMDAIVPGGMGGKDAMRALRKIDPHARVILSSGYSNDSVIAGHREHGFTDIILKPYTAQELGRIIRRVIRISTQDGSSVENVNKKTGS